MEIYREDIVNIDIDSGTVFRTFMNMVIGEGDAKANRYGFRCIRNGRPVSMNGCTIIGQFIRADGTTVTINGGAVVGEKAWIELPASCYAVEGNFTLVLKLAGTSITGTMRVIDGTVINTTNGTVVDPGNAVPDISALTAVIEDAEAAAAIINGISITAEEISDDDYDIVIVKEEVE